MTFTNHKMSENNVNNLKYYWLYQKCGDVVLKKEPMTYRSLAEHYPIKGAQMHLQNFRTI